MFGLLSSVFGLLLYWGLISLLVTMRRDGILPGASDVMGILCIFFFWLRIRGLAVSELPVMGLPWASFCYFFILFFLLESRTDNFF